MCHFDRKQVQNSEDKKRKRMKRACIIKVRTQRSWQRSRVVEKPRGCGENKRRTGLQQDIAELETSCSTCPSCFSSQSSWVFRRSKRGGASKTERVPISIISFFSLLCSILFVLPQHFFHFFRGHRVRQANGQDQPRCALTGGVCT